MPTVDGARLLTRLGSNVALKDEIPDRDVELNIRPSTISRQSPVRRRFRREESADRANKAEEPELKNTSNTKTHPEYSTTNIRSAFSYPKSITISS